MDSTGGYAFFSSADTAAAYAAADAVTGGEDGALTEDEELALLRWTWGHRWTIGVCDGIWEAAPREKPKPSETMTAKTATGIMWKIIRAEYAAGRM